jgi:hypothetical protein
MDFDLNPRKALPPIVHSPFPLSGHCWQSQFCNSQKNISKIVPVDATKVLVVVLLSVL